MHNSEVAQFSMCMECGEEVWPERERAYLLTDDDVLCQACAARRGGVYDELRDIWSPPPSLHGLAPSPP
jgi:hypothetical protein